MSECQATVAPMSAGLLLAGCGALLGGGKPDQLYHFSAPTRQRWSLRSTGPPPPRLSEG